jgi:hypothetical protein
MFMLLQKIQARIKAIYVYFSISIAKIMTSAFGNEIRDWLFDFADAAVRVLCLSIVVYLQLMNTCRLYLGI